MPLRALLSPSSIAIVGASADPDKLNGRVQRFLRERGYGGRVFPVNPRYETIQDLRCYPSLSAIGQPVDMALIALPASATLAAVEEAAAVGAKVALIFASGFAELGEDGRQEQDKLVAVARRAGMRLLGPNTVGVVNAFDGVLATFSQIGNNPVTPGPLAFVTQSGAVGTVFNTLANRRGLGLGCLVHTGNEADLTFVDAMEALIADDRIEVGAGYIEGLRDGAGLCTLAQRALVLGKPLIVMKVGRTRSGAQAAASHTGALASEDRVYDAVTRQFGIVRARNENHMLDLAEGLAGTALPNGNAVAFISQSGGAAVHMADLAESLGLRVPVLSEATQARLRTILPPFASFTNPVDASMQAVVDPRLLSDGIVAILDDPAIDMGVVWLQHMDAQADRIIALFEAAASRISKPWFVAWAATPPGVREKLASLGVRVMSGSEPALESCAALAGLAAARQRPPPPSLTDVPDAARMSSARQPGALAVAEMLSAAGIAVVPAKLATTPKAAAAIARDFTGPVALKIESPDILHKTEAGGVALGLVGDDAVMAACRTILERAAQHAPGAKIDGVLVQPMVSGSVELVVGLRNDPTFGMVVMAGIGGIFIEVLDDVAFRKAPITPVAAREMLDELKGRRMLDGVRGKPAADIDAIASLIAAVSRFGAANAEMLAELDLNPVMAGPDGAMAVDWLIVPTASKGTAP